MKKGATPDGTARRDRFLSAILDFFPAEKIAFRILFSTQFLRQFGNNTLLGTCHLMTEATKNTQATFFGVLPIRDWKGTFEFMGGEAITLIDGLILLAPDGLAIGLGKEGLSEDYLPSAVDTLQQLGDAFYRDQEADVTDLRATIFNLTLLARGEDREAVQTSLQKIAGQLKAIPRKDFMKAADSIGLFKPESEMAQIARAALAKSSLMDETVIVHPALVPSLLRWATQCRSENEVVRKKAIRQLEKIEASLKEAYGEATEMEKRLWILHQYSHFVILTSGLIPKDTLVNLTLLPAVVRGTGMSGHSPDDVAAFSPGKSVIALLQDTVFIDIIKNIKHETIHVLQVLEALRATEIKSAFRIWVNQNLLEFVRGQRLRYPKESPNEIRSQRIQEVLIAEDLARKQMFDGPTEEIRWGIWANLTTEKMASTLFEYGRADELFDKFFKS